MCLIAGEQRTSRLAEDILNFCTPEITKQNDLVHITAVVNSVRQGKLFLSMLRANSSLMDTSMVLLALEDLPISYAVADFGSELQFLKSLLGTSCCS